MLIKFHRRFSAPNYHLTHEMRPSRGHAHSYLGGNGTVSYMWAGYDGLGMKIKSEFEKTQCNDKPKEFSRDDNRLIFRIHG